MRFLTNQTMSEMMRFHRCWQNIDTLSLVAFLDYANVIVTRLHLIKRATL